MCVCTCVDVDVVVVSAVSVSVPVFPPCTVTVFEFQRPSPILVCKSHVRAVLEPSPGARSLCLSPCVRACAVLSSPSPFVCARSHTWEGETS